MKVSVVSDCAKFIANDVYSCQCQWVLMCEISLDNVICQKRFLCCLSIWMETKGVIKTIGLFWIIQRAADKLVLVNYFLLKQIQSPFPEGSIFIYMERAFEEYGVAKYQILYEHIHIYCQQFGPL